MVQPGVCYNGCCRSQPCMNGGTCVEHCHTPKKKFTCSCPKLYWGKVCEKINISSCMDVMVAASTVPSNGVYRITRSENNTVVPVYCAFKSPNQAWTLIESFSLENNLIFQSKAFHQDFPRSDVTPNWVDYRMSLSNMKYIRDKATKFRATCDYPKRVGSLAPDYLLGELSQLDIISDEVIIGACTTFLHINIRGNTCFKCTAPIYKLPIEHIHIDPNTNCDFRPQDDVAGADHFGFYMIVNPKSKCTATQQSTTQWWLGEQK